ncbi:phage integrase [Limnobaculum xujianqingii]|uniref:phage integrase n=1 Tax=Limnobaculum xujianqingii TaxID=2738837 RepID=UPI00112B4F2D|nr:tyrosine-type recombinase/integrase [Limnobaculum xujianqingii]
MSIKKLDDGRYEVDIRPHGRNGKRIRRKFERKSDALSFERYIIANFHNKEWLSKPADKRRLSEFIALWWDYYGQNLKHGRKRMSALVSMCDKLDDPMLYQINNRLLMDFRSRRLASGIKASSINHDMATLSGVFSVMIEAEEFHGDHPIRPLTRLKIQQTEMSYLSTEEIKALLSTAKDDARRIALLCLATGARWGEAHKLKAENILHGKVTFVETKNGKKRTVPISPEIVNEVKTRGSGLLFKVSYMTFYKLMREVKPDLPRGQAVHALRHTFATHFMMKGGNIIALQRILGHANIQQTMTYAHFSPDYLQDAVTLNPVSELSTWRPH